MDEKRLNEFKVRIGEYVERYNKNKKYNLNDYFRIINSQITAEKLKTILPWKLIGTRKPRKLIERAVKKLHEINLFKNEKISEDVFNEILKEISPCGHVIRLFIKHICKPITFPLFDRHVYRAFNYIETGNIHKGGLNKKIIEDSYEGYKAFFNRCCNYSKDLRKRKDIDSALMVFGKDLKKRAG